MRARGLELRMVRCCRVRFDVIYVHGQRIAGSARRDSAEPSMDGKWKIGQSPSGGDAARVTPNWPNKIVAVAGR
jgi:hypothetical protein